MICDKIGCPTKVLAVEVADFLFICFIMLIVLRHTNVMKKGGSPSTDGLRLYFFFGFFSVLFNYFCRTTM